MGTAVLLSRCQLSLKCFEGHCLQEDGPVLVAPQVGMEVTLGALRISSTYSRELTKRHAPTPTAARGQGHHSPRQSQFVGPRVRVSLPFLGVQQGQRAVSHAVCS